MKKELTEKRLAHKKHFRKLIKGNDFSDELDKTSLLLVSLENHSKTMIAINRKITQRLEEPLL